MRVVFRADASLQIGTGHVMRCLALADALRRRDVECWFICREHTGHLLDVVGKHGHRAVGLPPAPQAVTPGGGSTERGPAHKGWLGTDWETDAQQTRDALGSHPADLLIVDHYGIDVLWERASRTACRHMMVIDDLADRQHDCDLLLDYNLASDSARRYSSLVPSHCGLLLGARYALLQRQYADLHPCSPPREGAVRRLLVFFGGADSSNLTGMAVAAFLRLGRADIVVDVVTTRNNPHNEAIRSQARDYPNIRVHQDVPSLASLMVKADLAIGAGGVSAWERCCLGLPSLVITLADNQRSVAAELAERGGIRWIGHIGDVGETQLAGELESIIATGLPREWSERCSRIIDGLGADRVSALLTLNDKVMLKARRARLDDEELLLAWANDPRTRASAFNSGVIDASTHHRWYRDRLRDPDNCLIYIVETHEGLPIGQARFERVGEAWEIDYALDPGARRRGLGKGSLQAAMQALHADVDDADLVGRVKGSNVASRKVFEALGFESRAERGGEVVYRRRL